MTRHTPLSPGKPMHRTPLRRQSAKHRKGQAEWVRITRAAIRARGSYCQVRSVACVGTATQGHHILARSQGGGSDASNLLLVCGPCHKQLHERPAWAIARGYMRTRKVVA